MSKKPYNPNQKIDRNTRAYRREHPQQQQQLETQLKSEKKSKKTDKKTESKPKKKSFRKWLKNSSESMKHALLLFACSIGIVYLFALIVGVLWYPPLLPPLSLVSGVVIPLLSK